jgi:hypothetical protein
MRRVCEDLRGTTLPARLRLAFRRGTVSRQTYTFVINFVQLQEARQSADYDPAAQLTIADVMPLIDSAQVAMDAFAAIPADEQNDILALLMVRTRT